MEISPKFIWFFSQAILIALAIAGAEKRLRNYKKIFIIGITTFLVGLTGLMIRSSDTALPRGNAADFLFSPFIFVITHVLLRQLYKRVYHAEPTYVWLRSYDYEEFRKVNIWDKVVHVLPLILGMFLPFLGMLFE